MRKWLIVAMTVGVPSAIVLLYAVPPESGGFYPPCWFHSLTGLHCPGCGATRCLHALLHGDLLQAAAYNILFLFFLPALVLWSVRAGLTVLGYHVRPRRPLPGWVFFTLAALILLYGILRNLDVPPFDLLAPHQL